MHLSAPARAAQPENAVARAEIVDVPVKGSGDRRLDL
jgi:hypothetical protein